MPCWVHTPKTPVQVWDLQHKQVVCLGVTGREPKTPTNRSLAWIAKDLAILKRMRVSSLIRYFSTCHYKNFQYKIPDYFHMDKYNIHPNPEGRKALANAVYNGFLKL